VSIAKILVPVDGTPRDREALDAAIAAAKPFCAHIEALFAHPNPAEQMPVLGVPFTPDVMGALVDANTALFTAARERAHAAVAEACRVSGIALLDKQVRQDSKVTCTFRAVMGDPPKALAKAASLTDLVVLHPCAGSPAAFEAAIDVVLESHRPLLVAAGAVDPFGKALIAWDGSMAASRAVTAALPFLQHAGWVEIVCVCHRDAEMPGTSEIADYLKLQDVHAALKELKVSGTSIPDALMDYAARSRASLLVMGGFGHSRVRETLFGGVTNDILRKATFPIFLTH